MPADQALAHLLGVGLFLFKAGLQCRKLGSEGCLQPEPTQCLSTLSDGPHDAARAYLSADRRLELARACSCKARNLLRSSASVA
jgi:hypothetical protein